MVAVSALVFVSPVPPFPLDNGTRVRMHRLLTGLAAEFPTTLVTYEHHPDSGRPSYSQGDLASLLPGIDVVLVPGVGPQGGAASVAVGVRALLSPRPAVWRPYHRRSFVRAMAAEVRRRPTALVHFDYFAFFPSVPGVLNVRAPHNLESAIARQEAALQRGYGRIWHEAEWRKLRLLERRAFRTSHLCVAVSDLDARAMRSAGARRVAVCPNGTDPVEPCAPPARRRDEPLRILFVGSGNYLPYERGLTWFIRDVLPAVRARIPVEFDVVGRPPSQPVAAAGVRYAGPVPAVREWYERAHVAVVPVFEGSGTRLKIVEAMAHGRPVVSTRLGAEGLPLEASTHYLQAEKADAFATALLDIAERCRAGDSTLITMLQAGRSAIQHLFWPEIVGRLTELYRSEIDARERATFPRDPAFAAGSPS
jgi:glycosyltransferase involved in cell wall biosynthesis